MRLCVLAVLLSGCGEALLQARVDDLERKLEESQRRASTAAARAEALEDKVFLLTDQLESTRVASVRREPPRLPVVTLKPASEEPSDVVFEGAAKSTRPHLVLTGDKPQTQPQAKAKTPTPPTENLGVAPVPPIAASQQNDPLKMYRDAQDTLKAGKPDDAARAFRDFIRRFPGHDYSDNAQYWLGECFYARKQFAEAASEFRTVVTRHPFGNKAPDALLKLAFCLISLGDLGKARDLLAEVPRSYPRTEAARLAVERLDELQRVAPTGGTW